MLRFAIGSAVSAVLLLAPALASAEQDRQVYVGVRGGLITSSIDSAKMTQELVARGHRVTATVDDSDSAVQLYVGKSLSKRVSLEIGLMSLGQYDVRVSGTTTNPAKLADDIVDAQPKGGEAVSLTARFEVPIAGRLNFVSRVGGFYWRSDTDVITPSGRQAIDDDGLGVNLGLGLNLNVVAGLDLGLGWELLRPDPEGSASMFYGQVEYHFGQ